MTDGETPEHCSACRQPGDALRTVIGELGSNPLSAWARIPRQTAAQACREAYAGLLAARAALAGAEHRHALAAQTHLDAVNGKFRTTDRYPDSESRSA